MYVKSTGARRLATRGSGCTHGKAQVGHEESSEEWGKRSEKLAIVGASEWWGLSKRERGRSKGKYEANKRQLQRARVSGCGAARIRSRVRKNRGKHIEQKQQALSKNQASLKTTRLSLLHSLSFSRTLPDSSGQRARARTTRQKQQSPKTEFTAHPTDYTI